MTTLGQWIEDVRSYLDGERPEEANQVDATYVAGSGTLYLRYDLGNIAKDALITIGTNTLRVLATNPIGKSAVVVGGWNGSTDADAAPGALVRVSPRFTDARIARALTQGLAQLSSPTAGLFRVGTVNLTFDAAVGGYDLGSIVGLLKVLEVRRDITGPSQTWVRIRPGDWEVQRSAPTDDFASGAALKINLGSGSSYAPFSVTGVTVFAVQVVYAAAFLPPVELTDDVAASGIPSTAEDIPPIAAAIRLMSGREIPRNAMNAQGDSRRADEVPRGAVADSYTGLVRLLSQRVSEENERLRAQYPMGK